MAVSCINAFGRLHFKACDFIIPMQVAEERAAARESDAAAAAEAAILGSGGNRFHRVSYPTYFHALIPHSTWYRHLLRAACHVASHKSYYVLSVLPRRRLPSPLPPGCATYCTAHCTMQLRITLIISSLSINRDCVHPPPPPQVRRGSLLSDGFASLNGLGAALKGPIRVQVRSCNGGQPRFSKTGDAISASDRSFGRFFIPTCRVD